jgi:periplasmic divalent cation tolerance protein
VSSGGPEDVLTGWVSVPDAETGTKIADALVADRLAACVIRLPGVASTYVWNGETCRGVEDVLVIKTTRARWEAVMAAVRALHPWECPMMVAVAVETGWPAYIDWVRGSVRPS